MGMSEALTFEDKVTRRSVRQLTNGGLRSVHGYYDVPPWSPTDGRIAYTRIVERADEGEVWMMGADGADPRKVGSSRSLSANDGARAHWMADGSRICYRDQENGQTLIAWVNPDTDETARYPGDLRMMSPSGPTNAYHTNCGHFADHEVISLRDEHGVFVQDLDTGESKCIVTVEDCRQIHPRKEEIVDWHIYVKHSKWSPDGSRLMFVFTNEIRFSDKYCELPHVKDVYVVNADGSGLKRVGEFGNHPLWHPNGQEILTNSPFEGRPGNSLVLTDVETGQQRLATDRIGGFGHPSFSPDGRHLVVDHVLAKEGAGSLNLVDVEAGSVEHLVQLRVTDHSHVGTHLHPVWRQDGSQILYASDATGTAQLCVIDVVN